MNAQRSLLHAFTGNLVDGLADSAWPLLGSVVGSVDRQKGLALWVLPVMTDGAGNMIEAEALSDNADGQEAGINNRPVHLARLQGYSGAGWDRLRVGAAPVHAEALVGTRAGLVANKIGNWSLTHDPAANTQASVSLGAAGVGTRHICTSITATLNAGAGASGILKIYLIDGSNSAVDPILWSASVQAPAAGHVHIAISDLAILGGLNTDMTLEFSAAGGAGSQENITLTGYTVTTG